jgi:hypothetical protein
VLSPDFSGLSYHRGMGWQRPLAACALVFVVACGDNEATRTTSGSRLRLSWVDFGGGARILSPSDLWDAERQQTCVARLWTDGNTYCTPTAMALDPYYTSADCSTVGYYVESPEPPTYVLRYETEVALLARSAPATLDAYWVKDDEGCHGPNDGTGRHWYTAGAAVPGSDLVRIRTRASTGDDRIAVRASVTDDGLYAPLAFEDRALRAPCSLSTETASEMWCVPESGDIRYSDPSCSEPVLVTTDDAAPPRGIQNATCDPHVYAVGAETLDAPGFASIDDACAPSTDVGLRWFELHEHPVAAVARTHAVTGARLEPIVMNIDGTVVAAPELFDSEIGEPCARALSATGEYRCIPRNAGFVADMFADAACTTPVKVGLVTQRNWPVCGGPTPRYARNFGTPLVYELLGPRPTPAYWRDGASCTADTSTSYVIHDLGAPLPDDTWAGGALVRD